MFNIIKIFKPNLKLAKGSRLTSALFIGASMALAAGIIFGANIYYDIDTSKIMIEDTQQATTTQITTNTGSTSLTVTQRGSGAAFSATSTASMTSDIFKISNLGSGKSFVVEDSDTDSSPFVIDAGGNVGVASSTPSSAFSVQGNMLGSGNLTLYGSGTSTLGKIEITALKLTANPSTGFVLTSDSGGYGTWQSVSSVTPWTDSGTYIYPTNYTTRDIALATTTARYDLDVWGNAAFGTTTNYNTPLLLVNSYTTRVGVATSTPSDTFAVQGNITGSGNINLYGTSATSTFGAGIEVPRVKITSGAASGYVLTATDNLGNAAWQVGSNITPSNWQFASANAISPTTSVGIIVNASSTFNATTTITKGLIVDNDTLYVMADNNRVGIASSTPSDTFSVQGNIIGSGNIIVYGSATSTFTGDLAVDGLKIGENMWSSGALTITAQGGALIFQPAANSNASIVLGGTGKFQVGSSGQFYIDASGNATTSGNIYASAFISTGDNAYTRKSGDEIVRGIVPVFGFDLPARCKTSCNAGTYASISRVIENNDDIFPAVYSGTTRRYRFSIRYADATTTAATRTVWQVATSSDATYVSQFTLPPTGDLAKGFTTTTNFVTLPTTDDWFLRVTTGGSGNYDLQVYEILLVGIDQVD